MEPLIAPSHAMDEVFPPMAGDHLEVTAQVSDLGTVHVLVVEDDPAQQRVLDTLFAVANEKNQGAVIFEVVFAGSAREAISIIHDGESPKFQLILVSQDKPRPCTAMPTRALFLTQRCPF